jgi:hypothetical protein
LRQPCRMNLCKWLTGWLDAIAFTSFFTVPLIIVCGLVVWSDARDNELNTVSGTVVSATQACALRFRKGYGWGQRYPRPCEEAESYAEDLASGVRSITRGYLVELDFVDRRGQPRREVGFLVQSEPPEIGSLSRASYNPVGRQIQQPKQSANGVAVLRTACWFAFGVTAFSIFWLWWRYGRRSRSSSAGHGDSAHAQSDERHCAPRSTPVALPERQSPMPQPPIVIDSRGWTG